MKPTDPAGPRAPSAAERTYTVSDVAGLAGVSVRTLHYYDAIRLLAPSRRSAAGYRLYDDGDLERLQEVLFFRALGLPLDDVATLLAGGAFDRAAALALQREMLSEKVARLHAMIATIDKTLEAQLKGRSMDAEEMFGVFGDFDPAQYENEVEERWGDTEAYKESARRTARYTKADWQRFKAETERIGTETARLMDAGVPAHDPKAMDLAERARLQIDTWFYPCSHKMHVNLAEMYIADPRFTATYEKIHEGMAQYWHDAILANAARHQ